MEHTDFSWISKVLKEVGSQIVSWRHDETLRIVHSKAEYKTEADRRAHELITLGIRGFDPGVAVISEESLVHDFVRPKKYWLIDPIDGTASWFNGFNGFVTQAAYIENGVPLYGLVHAPLLNKTWSAIKGKGARLNETPLASLKQSDRLLLIDNTPKPHGILKKIIEHLPSSGYKECGSIGLKSVLVADGTVDLFIKDVVVRDWDIAPASVILGEVGGVLGMLDGSPYQFFGAYEKIGGFIVARNANIFEAAMNALLSYK